MIGNRRAIDRLLVLMVATGLATTVWVASLLIRRVDGLAASPFDLGFFQQIVWNVGQDGRWVSDFHEGSFLGLHFSPILVVPALIERLVWPDVRALSLIHAVAVGAFVPATFLFLRAGLRPSRAAAPLAAVLAVGLPVWGAMQEVIRSDFHPEVAGVALALLAGWAGLTRHPRAFWILVILALATREDVAYAILVIGLAIAARGSSDMRRHGRRATGVAAVWGVVVFGALMPWIRAGAPSDTAGYYAWLGGGWNVLAAPFTMTDAVVAALTRPTPWFVLAGMVASLGGLPLLKPRWFLLVAPPLVASMLSAHSFQADLQLQYPVILVVPLLTAALVGGRRLLAVVARPRRRGRPWLSGLALVPVAMLIVVAVVSGAWLQGSVPPFDDSDYAFRRPQDAFARLARVADAVPPSALLVTDEGLVVPLAGRTAIHRLAASAVPPGEAFVLLDRDAWSPTFAMSTFHDRILRMLQTDGRPVIDDDGRFILFGPLPVVGGG